MTLQREPVGRDWLADLRNKFAAEFPAPASLAPFITTEDGTVIVSDRAGKSASGRNLDEALANFRSQA